MSSMEALLKNNFLFESCEKLIPLVLRHLRPCYSHRLSLMIGSPVYLYNPYFTAMQIDDMTKFWYRKQFI